MAEAYAVGERARVEMFLLEDGPRGEATALVAIALDPKSKVAGWIRGKLDGYRKERARRRAAGDGK